MIDTTTTLDDLPTLIVMLEKAGLSLRQAMHTDDITAVRMKTMEVMMRSLSESFAEIGKSLPGSDKYWKGTR